MKKLLITFLGGIICLSGAVAGDSVESTESLSAWQILQKTGSRLWQADYLEVIMDFWAKKTEQHVRVHMENVLSGMDDYKVNSRISVSSLDPENKFSRSYWVQLYRFRGIPFVWSVEDKKWEKEIFSWQEEDTGTVPEYSFFRNLFLINEQNVEPESVVLSGMEEKFGQDCFIISFNINQEMFKVWGMTGDLSVKLWVVKENFIPVTAWVEGNLEGARVQQIIYYYKYNSGRGLEIPEDIAAAVENEKELLKNGLPELTDKLVRLRGWDSEMISGLKMEFVNREKMMEVGGRKAGKAYSGKVDGGEEERVLRWLGLIPEQADYAGFISGIDRMVRTWVYEHDDKKIFIGDWVSPEQIDFVLVCALSRAFQVESGKIPPDKSNFSRDYDAYYARTALYDGEVYSLGLECILSAQGESFKEKRDIFPYLEKILLKDMYLRDKMFHSIGLYGCLFLKEYLQRYDWKQMDRLYREEPVSTEEVLHPVSYMISLDLDKKRLPDKAGKGVVPVLDKDWEEKGSVEIGEYLLQIALNSVLDTDISQKAARGWKKDRLDFFKDKTGRKCSVFTAEWDSGTDAREFFDAYRLLKQSRGAGFYEDVPLDDFISGICGEEEFILKIRDNKVYVFSSRDLSKEMLSDMVDKYEGKN